MTWYRAATLTDEPHALIIYGFEESNVRKE
jgi:hypothetical protein